MKTIVGKVVVLGRQGVGKTSTVTRYIDNSFTPNVAPTIGASFITCKVTVENTIVKLQVWDTAGQERFKAMAPMFYRNSNAALLIFDITSEESFESMKSWVVELKRNVEEAMVLCVVGNKLDLAEQRKVSRDEALQYSKNIGASYYECSARTDQGIGVVFDNVARELIKLSTKNITPTLKVYDNEDMNNLMAKSSELEPTDVGKEEVVHLSINSIAHGSTVKSRCC